MTTTTGAVTSVHTGTVPGVGEVMVTTYADGWRTMAVRAASWHTWGPEHELTARAVTA